MAEIPMGKLLRQNDKHTATFSGFNSIDDQIASLEKQLNNNIDNHNDENEDNEDDEDEEENELRSSEKVIVEKDDTGRPVKLMSKSLLKHRIEPLPSSLLPSATCGFAGGRNSQSSGEVGKKRSLKTVQFATIASQVEPVKQKRPPVDPSMTGMEATVRELLSNYVPSSHEKKPFWCRVCQFQGSSESELLAHRDTVFHRKAAEIEKSVCSCRPCKKQFTSPEQLKEHLRGKLHQEMLSKQRRGGSSNRW